MGQDSHRMHSAPRPQRHARWDLWILKRCIDSQRTNGRKEVPGPSRAEKGTVLHGGYCFAASWPLVTKGGNQTFANSWTNDGDAQVADLRTYSAAELPSTGGKPRIVGGRTDHGMLIGSITGILTAGRLVARTTVRYPGCPF